MGTGTSRLDHLGTDEVLRLIAEYLNDRGVSLTNAFAFLDVDHSGFVTWDEFLRGVQLCVDGLPGHATSVGPETLVPIFNHFDVNKDGRLSMQEFARVYDPPRASHYVARQHGPGDPNAYVAKAKLQQNLADDVVRRVACSIIRTGHRPEDVFASLDRDRNGTLSRTELESAMLRFQPDLSLSEREAAFRRFDANQSGAVDVVEFCAAVKNVNANALIVVEDKIRILGEKFKQLGYSVFDSFSVFDRNGDGFLTRDEWQRSMVLLGVKFNESEFESVFRLFDVNNDGCMSIAEFRTFFQDTIDRSPALQPGTMPVYNPPPAEQPWETEIFDLVRSCLSVERSGFCISEVFRRLDITGSSALTPYEFNRVLTTYRPDLTPPHLEQLFRKVNTSNSGAITLGEFVRRFG